MNSEVWRKILDGLKYAREAGCAVYLLTPEELKGANPRDVEDQFGVVATEIIDTLKPSHWDEDPEYSVEAWKDEVTCDDTRQGYAEWVQSQRGYEEEDGD